MTDIFLRMSRCSSLIALLLLVLVAGGAGGCAGQAESIREVVVRVENPEVRRETVSELREAWQNREVAADLDGKRVEQRFLVRLSHTVRRYKDTESYRDICRLWNECLHDHLARFPESAT